MKKLPSILFLFLSSICFGQKSLIGLYGKCTSEFSSYACQQVLFKENKTFIFYDLLHLRGWSLSEGTWKMNGDTVILNSNKEPFSISYKGSSSTDTITIITSDGKEPLPFANIKFNAKTFNTDFSGRIKYPKQEIDTISIYYISTFSGPIVIDKEKIKNTDTLVITLESDLWEILF